MVSVLSSSVVDRGCELRSDQTKIKLVFVASDNVSESGVTCLSAVCRINELAL